MTNLASDESWSTLKTISTFDNGSSTSFCDDQITQTHQQVVQKNFLSTSLLVESLIQILCKILEQDSKQQQKLYEVICTKLHDMNLLEKSHSFEEFSYIRTDYQRALFELFAVTKSCNSNKKSIEWHKKELKLLQPEKVMFWSRYNNEYEELEFLAKGGFGKVFKVKNKLDGEDYAMKKIYIKYLNVNSFMNKLSEVKMLAKLHHPNIVTYKAAWLERFDPKEHLSISSENSSSTSSEESLTDIDSSSKSDSNVFTIHAKQSKNHECAILYIQMQLCKQTLREWIDLRNTSEKTLNFRVNSIIFQQICRGVRYIHSQNIVHHDLKPSNIFVNHDLTQVQVGDFGLACMLNHDKNFTVFPHRDCRVGTKLYSAPEQLAGKCDTKSDIYTLGIILFELNQIFQTQMERSKLIDNLKKSMHLPQEIESNLELCELIKTLMNINPLERPTAQSLLDKCEMNNDSINKDELILNLYKQLSEKDKLIESLQEKIRLLETKL